MEKSLALPQIAWLRLFRRRLGSWFDLHAKDLPWRKRKDAYSVWISEIMLQQTQVATVCGYFERFLRAFPTVDNLAQAEEEQVLRLWEGLGYYRRARQLHKAAKFLVAEHGGEFPREIDAVRRLPGIGRYTAGAILSIAYDIPQPILEANTLRVYSRLLGYEGDPHSSAGQKLLWSMAEAVIPKTRSGRVNQALMELGREVCKARNALCDNCPVAPLCKALEKGLQNRIPRPKAKPKIEEVCEAAVVVRRRSRVLLVKRGDGGRWAGLWDFPRFPLNAEHPAARRKELIDGVRRLTGVTIAPGELLQTLQHSVTRFRITLECYAAEYVSEDGRKTSSEIKWLRPAELEKYPLNTTGRKIASIIL
ncbi:MAG: A/G-specific adenine glycosylase [Pirellulales bacterium]|nr:A/G-specific adenine glycosylase [Pirellulales bacterium]